MKKILLCYFMLFTYLNAEDIIVLAASSLKYALEDIKKEFLKDRINDNINISFVASGKAYNQIINGHLAHLFIAADTKYTKKLFEKNYTNDRPINYTKGKLVLFSNNKNIKLSLDILKNDVIKHIAIPNPKLAPYGIAAMQAIKNLNIDNKIVFGESIAQATQYVKLGLSEIGFSSLSMVIKDKETNYFIIDDDIYEPIFQSMILTKNGQKSKLANEFRDFILSNKAQKIFLEYGYSRP